MTTDAVTGPGRYSVYTGRVTNWQTVAAAAVAALPLLLLAGRPARWSELTWPLLVAAFGVIGYVLTGSSVRTTAGPGGVTVHFGTIGWPRCTYPLERIARAEVVDVALWSVAGGFWWTPRRTCCTVRTGPALRLLLRDGRTVTVSAPDPRAAVSAIEESAAR
jgi:hypothetical protein